MGAYSHLDPARFLKFNGIEMTHIPYKGTPPAMTDLVAGHVQVIFDNLPSSVPLIRDGKVRVRAQYIATPQRLEMKIFGVFPRLKRLEVQTVLATGQGRLKLSPSNRQIDLRR